MQRSHILDKVTWAKLHDEECKMIANNARLFAIKNILPEHCIKYCHKVLLKQASLQKFSVKDSHDESFELLSDPLTEEEKIERRKILADMGY